MFFGVSLLIGQNVNFLFNKLQYVLFKLLIPKNPKQRRIFVHKCIFIMEDTKRSKILKVAKKINVCSANIKYFRIKKYIKNKSWTNIFFQGFISKLKSLNRNMIHSEKCPILSHNYYIKIMRTVEIHCTLLCRKKNNYLSIKYITG